jgi:hypothetical protein
MSMAATARRASLGKERCFLDQGTCVPPMSAVMRVVRGLAPRKTDRALQAWTGYSDRAARMWLKKNRLPSAALIRLLRGEHGDKFIDALIADVRPEWRDAIVRQREIDDVRQRQALLRRKLERLNRDLAGS